VSVITPIVAVIVHQRRCCLDRTAECQARSGERPTERQPRSGKREAERQPGSGDPRAAAACRLIPRGAAHRRVRSTLRKTRLIGTRSSTTRRCPVSLR
jgi:hypothetical protein